MRTDVTFSVCVSLEEPLLRVVLLPPWAEPVLDAPAPVEPVCPVEPAVDPAPGEVEEPAVLDEPAPVDEPADELPGRAEPAPAADDMRATVPVICTLWFTCWLRSTDADEAARRYSSATDIAAPPVVLRAPADCEPDGVLLPADAPADGVLLPGVDDAPADVLPALELPVADPPVDELPVAEPPAAAPLAVSTSVSLYIAVPPVALVSRSRHPVTVTVCDCELACPAALDVCELVDPWPCAWTPTNAQAEAIVTAVTMRFIASSSSRSSRLASLCVTPPARIAGTGPIPPKCREFPRGPHRT
jgi:hypothetical protein